LRVAQRFDGADQVDSPHPNASLLLFATASGCVAQKTEDCCYRSPINERTIAVASYRF
jgi:hypothetical protein